MESAPNLEQLLEHADWVRRLAHSLIADPARADDVAQETWLAALAAPPRDAHNLRGWLGAVVRNAARRSKRSARRRLERESSAARDEALPSAAELVEQADLQREIAGLVIALDEPYRETLLLRYYQGISAEAIAARMGVPLNTVRTRLQRGTAQLRERLDRRFGKREAWCVALLPLARAPLATAGAVQGSFLVSLGALVMAVKLKWIALAAVALALGVWWEFARETELPERGVVASAPDDAPVQAPEAPREVSDAAASRASVPSGAQGSIEDLPSLPATVHTVIIGRCVDLAGKPLAGVEFEWIDQLEARIVEDRLQVGKLELGVSAKARERLAQQVDANRIPEFLLGARGLAEALRGETYLRPRVVSEIDGTFRFEQESAGGELELVRKDLRVLDTVHVEEFPEQLYVIAQCIELAGTVVDSAQRPIVGAEVSWWFSLEGATAFPYVPDAVETLQGSAQTDVDGRFRLEHVPLTIGRPLHLSVEKAGYVAGSLPIPDHSDPALSAVLEKKAPEPDHHISGHVIHRDGRAAVGAGVSFGQDSAATDAAGNFRIRLTTSTRVDTPLTAHERGSRPASLSDFGVRVLEQKSVVDGVVLVLDDALPPIRGRVLDAQGSPCPKWRVSLVGATQHGTSNWTLEGVAADQKPDQSTDAEGRFRFDGLLDHAYRVRAWNEKNMLAVESDLALPGNEDVIVRVPADALVDHVAGRVVSRRGLPIDGATIEIGVVLFRLPGGGYSSSAHKVGKTDAQGRFELHDFPRRGCVISASDPRIQLHLVELDESMVAREIVLEVDLDLRFHVEPRHAGEFDRFELLDHSGERVVVTMHLHSSESSDFEVVAHDGTFPMCSTTEAAETLVLYKDAQEIRRVPLALRPGEINVLAP